MDYKMDANQLLCLRSMIDRLGCRLTIEAHYPTSEYVNDIITNEGRVPQYDALLDEADEAGTGYATRVFLLFYSVTSAKCILDDLLEMEGTELLTAEMKDDNNKQGETSHRLH